MAYFCFLIMCTCVFVCGYVRVHVCVHASVHICVCACVYVGVPRGPREHGTADVEVLGGYKPPGVGTGMEIKFGSSEGAVCTPNG